MRDYLNFIRQDDDWEKITDMATDLLKKHEKAARLKQHVVKYSAGPDPVLRFICFSNLKVMKLQEECRLLLDECYTMVAQFLEKHPYYTIYDCERQLRKEGNSLHFVSTYKMTQYLTQKSNALSLESPVAVTAAAVVGMALPPYYIVIHNDNILYEEELRRVGWNTYDQNLEGLLRLQEAALPVTRARTKTL